MPFSSFMIAIHVIILSFVCIEAFGLTTQPSQALLKECNKIAGKCGLCGKTKQDELSYADLKKALQCDDDLKDELVLHNRAGGLALLSNSVMQSPNLYWDVCELEPEASDAADSDQGESLLERFNGMSQCKDRACTEQNLYFRLCSLDSSDVDLECFDGDGVRSYVMEKGMHVIYLNEDIKCKECLLQMSLVDGKNILPLGCFPISIMAKKHARKNKIKRLAAAENISAVTELSTVYDSGLDIGEITSLKPEITEAFSHEGSKDLPEFTKSVTFTAAQKQNPVEKMGPVAATSLKPKFITGRIIPRAKFVSNIKPANFSVLNPAPNQEKQNVGDAKDRQAATRKAVTGTTRKAARQTTIGPIVSTKNSVDDLLQPAAQSNPLLNAPSAKTTKTFDDLWKEKMLEFEKKKMDRFQAFKSKNDPPSKNDPYIKLPGEETFESKNSGCTLIELSKVPHVAFLLVTMLLFGQYLV